MRSRLTTITKVISTAAIAAKEIILVFLVTIEPPGATGYALPHAFSPSELCRGNKKIAGRKKPAADSSSSLSSSHSWIGPSPAGRAGFSCVNLYRSELALQSGLADCRAFLSDAPASHHCQRNYETAGSLRSSGVTPAHRYC